MADLALLWKNDLKRHTYTYDGFRCNGANPNPGGIILPDKDQNFTGQDAGFQSFGAYKFNGGQFDIGVCFHERLSDNNWVRCPYGTKQIGLNNGSHTLEAGFVSITVNRSNSGM